MVKKKWGAHTSPGMVRQFCQKNSLELSWSENWDRTESGIPKKHSGKKRGWRGYTKIIQYIKIVGGPEHKVMALDRHYNMVPPNITKWLCRTLQHGFAEHYNMVPPNIRLVDPYNVIETT